MSGVRSGSPGQANGLLSGHSEGGWRAMNHGIHRGRQSTKSNAPDKASASVSGYAAHSGVSEKGHVKKGRDITDRASATSSPLLCCANALRRLSVSGWALRLTLRAPSQTAKRCPRRRLNTHTKQRHTKRTSSRVKIASMKVTMKATKAPPNPAQRRRYLAAMRSREISMLS